jgi:hypothetical protein
VSRQQPAARRAPGPKAASGAPAEATVARTASPQTGAGQEKRAVPSCQGHRHVTRPGAFQRAGDMVRTVFAGHSAISTIALWTPSPVIAYLLRSPWWLLDILSGFPNIFVCVFPLNRGRRRHDDGNARAERARPAKRWRPGRARDSVHDCDRWRRRERPCLDQPARSARRGTTASAVVVPGGTRLLRAVPCPGSWRPGRDGASEFSLSRATGGSHHSYAVGRASRAPGRRTGPPADCEHWRRRDMPPPRPSPAPLHVQPYIWISG